MAGSDQASAAMTRCQATLFSWLRGHAPKVNKSRAHLLSR